MTTFKKLVGIVLIMVIRLFTLSDAMPSPQPPYSGVGVVANGNKPTGGIYSRYCQYTCYLPKKGGGVYVSCKECWCPNDY
ncbi:13003_t:CDS:1, partial [Ambispora gerdemannii]